MPVDGKTIQKNDMYSPVIESLKKSLKDTFEIPEGYTYKEYDEYFVSGSRKEFERKYFMYRRRLAASFMLYYIYEADEYRDILVETIWCICNEFSWCLPNHSENETEISEKFDFIDLFAAETGEAMAEILHFMGDKLPERLTSRMRFELNRRIFAPFERKTFWWETVDFNWSAVCAGCVGMAYLYENKEAFEKVKPRILGAMDCFLSGFSEEGVCFEGLDYWNYGFGYFVYFAELLLSMTGEDLLHREMAEKAAHFQQKMFISGTIVSFSDCPREANYLPGLTAFLAKTYKNIHIPQGINPSYMDFCGRFASAVRNVLWQDESTSISEETGTEFLKTAGWFLAHKQNFSFAAKAGNNDEPHNHNDVGSFILAANGDQVLCDYGSGEYTQAYFTPETRYLDLCNSSLGHSVPIIDETAQSAGAEFAAAEVAAGEDFFTADIGGAYKHKSLQSLKRRFEVRENGVALCDTYAFSDNDKHEICERFVSLKKPILTKDGVQIGGFVLKCDSEPTFSEGIVKNHSTMQPETLYFTDYCGDFKTFALEILKIK